MTKLEPELRIKLEWEERHDLRGVKMLETEKLEAQLTELSNRVDVLYAEWNKTKEDLKRERTARVILERERRKIAKLQAYQKIAADSAIKCQDVLKNLHQANERLINANRALEDEGLK